MTASRPSPTRCSWRRLLANRSRKPAFAITPTAVTAFVDVDEAVRRDLTAAIARACELRRTTQRPPVAENENLCPRCSLAPVCLPEEERLGRRHDAAPQAPPRLFPSRREEQTLHIVSPRAHLGRSGAALLLTNEDEKQKIPIEQIDSVVVHGFAQVSTQAVHLCAARGGRPMVHDGGQVAAGTACSPGRVQQRIRQYAGLSDAATRLELARRLVEAKIDTQRRYVLAQAEASPPYRPGAAPVWGK